jgi:hypothetical protein
MLDRCVQVRILRRNNLSSRCYQTKSKSVSIHLVGWNICSQILEYPFSIVSQNDSFFICEAAPVHGTKLFEHHCALIRIKCVGSSVNLLYRYMNLVAVMLIANCCHLSTHCTFGRCSHHIYRSNRNLPDWFLICRL